jgi:hypothetical protein
MRCRRRIQRILRQNFLKRGKCKKIGADRNDGLHSQLIGQAWVRDELKNRKHQAAVQSRCCFSESTVALTLCGTVGCMQFT